MVAGRLEVKNGKYFVMISYLDEYGSGTESSFPPVYRKRAIDEVRKRNLPAFARSSSRLRRSWPAIGVPICFSQIICFNGWRSLKCA